MILKYPMWTLLKAVDEIVASLKVEHGKIGEMTVRRGKRHDYLGMTLDFTKDGKFIIDMEKYIDDIIVDLPNEFDGVASTPAAGHLFKTRENAPKLDMVRAELFHRTTAQLLFLS